MLWELYLNLVSNLIFDTLLETIGLPLLIVIERLFAFSLIFSLFKNSSMPSVFSILHLCRDECSACSGWPSGTCHTGFVPGLAPQ